MTETSEKKLHCQVVTPDKQVIDKQVHFVVLTTFDGEIGILPQHAPVLCKLIPSALRVFENPDSKPEYLYVGGGFAEVLNNSVTIVAPEAMDINDINPTELEEEIKKLADETDKSIPLEGEARARALAIAEAKKKVYYSIKEKLKENRN